MEELNKGQICKEYIETNIGIEALAIKYHVGKVKVKSILAEFGIEPKRRGGQKGKSQLIVDDWHIEKYPEIFKYHYIATDKNNGFTTRDYMNEAGILTSHINKEYGVPIPTLYDRRKYYMQTGNYWWEQWFNISCVADVVTKKCAYCDWETIDIDNNSGAYEQHLLKAHGITKLEHLKNHPEDISYFKLVSKQKNRQMETNTDNYVTCAVCGMKLARIDTHHLKTHEMTKYEYIQKYGQQNLISNNYRATSTEQGKLANINGTFHKQSSEEIELTKFIQSFGLKVVNGNRKILNGMEVDIFVPELNIAFEYNGCLFHTEKYGKNKNYHLDKTIGCFNNGVKLYHIFDDDFHYHKDILLNKIKVILGKSDAIKIRSNKCVIKCISKSDSDIFLNKYHIQGKATSTIYLGAYYNDILVAVMLFLNEGNNNWNLTRFATNSDYYVYGIGGKLFKYFTENYQYNIVKSFAERRLTPDPYNNLYTKIGFSIDEIQKPDYRYFNQKVDRYKRFHKFGFRKQILHKKYGFPLTMTESEMTDKLGYSKIWDCGLIKYIYINKH